MSKKKLAEFNIQNAKYALEITDGYETPKAFTYAQSFSKQANQNVTDLYGDGRVQATFVADNGLTGSLGLMAIDNDYEKAMGRYMEIEGGLAEISQHSVKKHAIYIETNVAEEGSEPVIAKAWYFGCTSSKAEETFNQNTDNVNINAIEYPLSIHGVKLQNSDGSEYIDPKTGKSIYIYRVISLPGDANYSTFGDSVPTPTAKAELTTSI